MYSLWWQPWRTHSSFHFFGHCEGPRLCHRAGTAPNSTAAPCCFGNDTVPMSFAPLMSMGGSVAPSWLPGSSIHPCSITQLTAVFTSSTVCLTRPVFFLGNSSAAPTAARGPNPAQDSNILWYPCNTSKLPFSTAGGAGAHVEKHHPSSIRTPNPGAVPALCAL